jgi:hypothetical protein
MSEVVSIFIFRLDLALMGAVHLSFEHLTDISVHNRFKRSDISYVCENITLESTCRLVFSNNDAFLIVINWLFVAEDVHVLALRQGLSLTGVLIPAGEIHDGWNFTSRLLPRVHYGHTTGLHGQASMMLNSLFSVDLLLPRNSN